VAIRSVAAGDVNCCFPGNKLNYDCYTVESGDLKFLLQIVEG